MGTFTCCSEKAHLTRIKGGKGGAWEENGERGFYYTHA